MAHTRRGPKRTDEFMREKGLLPPDTLVDATDGWYVWEKIPLSTAIYYKRWWRLPKEKEES